MFSLIVQSGKHTGKKVKLSAGEFTIGRDEGVSLKIGSSEVSRLHCKLVVKPEGVTVVEMGSRNGTFVDGIPIHGSQLIPTGSKLSIGPMTFRLEGGTPAPKKPAPSKVLDSEAKAAQGLSDDEIASLLTDEHPVLGSSDTTIGPTQSSPSSLKAAPPKVITPRKTFRTIAEEAQEIIRLHLESLAAGDKKL